MYVGHVSVGPLSVTLGIDAPLIDMARHPTRGSGTLLGAKVTQARFPILDPIAPYFDFINIFN